MSIIKNLEDAVAIMNELEEEGYVMDFDPTYIIGCTVIKQLSGLNKKDPNTIFMKEYCEIYTCNERDLIGDDYVYFIRPEKIIESEAFCS